MKLFLLSLQHLFTMFSATVLVPILIGTPISVALFTSGIGTLIFHFITKRKVPIYLGSSFAFIQPFIQVTSYYQGDVNQLQYASFGIACQSVVYIQFSFLIKYLGMDKVKKLFPPLITGTIIILIGLLLSTTQISMASSNWGLQIITLAIILIVKLYTKGFISSLPILLGVVVSYIIQMVFFKIDFNFTTFFSVPEFYFPKFSWYQISIIVPQQIAPALEHIGDIYQVSEIVGEDFTKTVGLHKTILSDGIATGVAGLLGGPANTTYSENTGVLALTKQYNPLIMEIQQIMQIALSFFSPLQVVIQNIPTPIMGGQCIVLFGMIAQTGVRTLITNQIKLTSKNTLIMQIMLIIGVGGAKIEIGSIQFQGIGLQQIVGILLNLIIKDSEIS